MWPIGITADDLWFYNISFWYMHYIGIIDIIVSKTGLYSSTCPIGHDQGRIFVHKKLMKGNSLMPYLISYMVIGCTSIENRLMVLMILNLLYDKTNVPVHLHFGYFTSV